MAMFVFLPGVTPCAAIKPRWGEIMTFEETVEAVEQQQKHLSKVQSGGGSFSSTIPGSLCSAYAILKPILQVLEAMPFIPSLWRDVMLSFRRAMDATCIVPQGAAAQLTSLDFDSVDRAIKDAMMSHSQASASPVTSSGSLNAVCAAYRTVRPILDFGKGFLPAPWTAGISIAEGVLDTLCPTPAASAFSITAKGPASARFTDLNEVSELGIHASSLRRLGYTSFEQFMGAAQVAGPEMQRFLGVSLDSLVNGITSVAPKMMSSAEESLLAEATYPLGVLIDEVPRPRVAFAMSVAAPDTPPGCVNWSREMPPVKNQANRGTCVAFATTAVYEHYLKNIAGSLASGSSLSEQFLYWDCKRNDSHPNDEGTWLAVAFPSLQRDGECFDILWPYNPDPIPANEGQGPAPANAIVDALSKRISSYVQISPTSVQDIRAHLALHRCVAFSIPVYNSWYANPYVKLSGDIMMPIPGEIRVGGHAMCIVGCEDLPGNPELGSGRFIIRNSWDSKWGIHSRFGPGYGTIPFAYIASYCVEAFSLP